MTPPARKSCPFRSFRLSRRAVSARLLRATLPACLVFTVACAGPKDPPAIRGVVDLRAVNLAEQVVALNGRWRFDWGRLVPPVRPLTAGPAVGSSLPEEPAAFIDVPAVWNGQSVAGRTIPGLGVGTYRLRVLLPDPSPNTLGVHLLEIGTAYRLFANGREVHAAGVPHSDPARARADSRTGVFMIRPEGRTLDLLVHVSNHNNKWGGIWHSVKLGSELAARRDRDRHLWAEFVMFGILMALGVYHLILFGFRPRVKSPFYFGLFCVAVAFRTLLTGERALIGLLPAYDWEWSYRFEYLSFYLSVPAWLAYVGSLYPGLVSRRTLILLISTAAVFVGMVLVTPVLFYADYLLFFQVLTVISGLYTTYVSARAVRAAEIGATTFLVGWLILFVAVGVDIVAAQGLIATVNFVPGFFVFFVAVQSTIIAQRFARAFSTAEQLTEEMDRRVRDRTEELARAKDEAERSNLAKSQFLSVVSHELRTPMHGILGAADLLTESRITPEQHGYIRILKRSGARMMKLIGEILDMSRIEAGRVDIAASEFSVRELMEQSLVALGVRARAKSIDLSVVVDPDVPDMLIGDPARLEQVLLNLVGNALKFSEGGRVSVRASRDSMGKHSIRLAFSVTDTGPGIPPDLMDVLFHPFIQGDSSLTRRHGGTGLGLAISRGLVQLMGGEIGHRNLPEGGAEFRFTAILGVKEGVVVDEAGPVPPEAPIRPDLGGMRVLFAEDDEDNVRLIRHYLQGTGVEVVVVGNGQRAIEEAEAGFFDVLFLDIQMPVLDGLEAARGIRARERDLGVQAVPIFALSANAMAHDTQRSLDAGCTRHLTKPISRAQLLDALADVKRAGRA